MARRHNNGIRFRVDWDQLAEALGTMQAMARTDGPSSKYLSNIVDEGIAEQNEAFNRYAVAVAQTNQPGTQINHMFEWGTLGINKGRSNVRPNPFSERARLWKTFVLNTGGAKTLGFTYKPSVGLVPNPTVGSTKMRPEVIKRLKRHKFIAKARVFEQGETVTIKRKGNTKKLLIPNHPSRNIPFTSADEARGYALRNGPLRLEPGKIAGMAGNFTTTWVAFWEGRATEAINLKVYNSYVKDFKPSGFGKRRRAPKNVQAINFDKMVNSYSDRAFRRAENNSKKGGGLI